MGEQRIDAGVGKLFGLSIAMAEVWSDGTEHHVHIAHCRVEAMRTARREINLVGEQPTGIGQCHHVANARICAVAQI